MCAIRVLAAALLSATLASGAPYADRFVDVNGLRIHYLDWGSNGKPPLVMLHGIGRVAHSFDHIAPGFTASYHVIAMDLRGHGDSGWSTTGDYLVEDYVRDLDGLVERLKLHDIVLLGNSTGGRVAQVYAGMHPNRVARLIVEDVGPERPADIADSFARRVKAEADGWASEEDLVRSLRASDPRTAESLLRNYAHFGTKRRADGRLVWKRDPNLVKGFVPTELWRYVSKISCPTIYILGARSAIVPPETHERLKRTVPGVQIVVMPDVGHYPHLEAPDAYIATVRTFLQQPRPRR